MEISLKLYNSDGTAFPNSENQVEINNFNFNANRGGTAPSITATVEYPICLDDLLNEFIYCSFNMERYYIKSKAPSSYDNKSVMYKHSLTLVSERSVFETVYFYDVVSSYNDGTPNSNNTEFSFFGNAQQFADRLQLSMNKSGLGISTPTSLGYTVVVDADVVLENKEVSFKNSYLIDALKSACEIFDTSYYFIGKVLHIGYSTPLVLPNFKYGIDNSLLAISKSNDGDDIYTRMSGYGEETNVPYFYPNENPKALVPHHSRGEEVEVINRYKLAKATATVMGNPISWGTKLVYTDVTRTRTYDQSNVFYEIEPTGTNTSAYATSGACDIHYSIDTNNSLWIKKMVFDIPDNVQTDLTINLKEKTQYTTAGIEHLYSPYIKRRTILLGYIDNNDVEHQLSTYQSNVFSPTIPNTPPNPPIPDFTTDYTLPNSIVATAKKLFVRVSYSLYNWRVIYYPAMSQNYFGERNVPLEWLVYGSTAIVDLGWNTTAWSLNDNEISLHNFGIKIEDGVSVTGDYIYFLSENLIPYSKRLLPPIYRKSGGNRLFYDAKNYPFLPDGFYALDEEMGREYAADGAIQNDSYKKGNGDYYNFENEFNKLRPKELIKDYNIKPTIENVHNQHNQRIDRFAEIAFDEYDNDEINESTGEYIHPYFFVKLRKFNGEFGFNLFDSAIEDGDMTIEMTSGKCGSCKFVIGVTEDTKINPVEVYENDVYENGVLIHSAGDLKRDTNGNVKLSGNQARQQDTINYECWIALKKDIDTFGVIMPNATNDYKPTAIVDSFVITNILLPEAYITAAENELEKAIIKDLFENNYYKYKFTLTLSSIYYDENRSLLNQHLHEYSLIQFEYDSKVYKYYITNMSVSVKDKNPLPTITLNLDHKYKTQNRGLSYRLGELVRNTIPNIVNNVTENIGSVRGKKNENNNVFVGESLIVNDDVVIGGVSVKKMLNSLKTSVNVNSQSLSDGNIWAKVANRSDVENSFIDGCFVNNYNSYHTENIETGITLSDDNAVGGNSICADFFAKSTLEFSQIVSVRSGENTISFFAKTDTKLKEQETFYVVITLMKEMDDIGEAKSFPIKLEEEYTQCLAVVQVPDDVKYIRIGFYSEFETERKVYINGVMCLYGNFASKEKSGFFIANQMTPNQYITNNTLIEATEKSLGGVKTSEKYNETKHTLTVASNNGVLYAEERHFVFEWRTIESTIDIQHDLGKNPSVTVVDTAGSEVVCDIIHKDKNNVKLIFSSPTRGVAYFN